MNKRILAATAAAFLLGSVGAWAGTDVKGTIQSIDQQTKQITLADGKTYTADASVDLASFKAGDSVTITTEEKNGQMTVTQLTKN